MTVPRLYEAVAGLLGLVLVTGSFSAAAQSPRLVPTPNTTAVPHGTLVMVGGGATKSICRHFVELSGGADAQIVCVPTAHPFGRWGGWCRKFFRKGNIPRSRRTILHTQSPEVADTDAFVRPLRTADAVWFAGGRQWRLVDAYAGTKAFDAFWSVLRRGGVIGGTSAGASIQGSFLVRGDTQSKTIMMGDHRDGFGFLPHSAIDQHLRARGREYDLIEVIEALPDLLGIGLDEGTAAIVQGDTLRTMGTGIVAIYDAHRWSQRRQTLTTPEKPFFLAPGTRFDLRTRRVLASSP